MKRNTLITLAAGVVLLAVAAGLSLQSQTSGTALAATSQDAEQGTLYVCAMHPWETSHSEDSCTICGMALSEVEGYQAGDPIPSEDELFVDPDNPMKVSAIAHKDWIPITKSPFYQPREDGDTMDGHDHSGMDQQSMDTPDELYVCSMHPYEAAHEEGKCSICGMPLSEVQGYEAGDDMPKPEDLYVDPDDPMKVSIEQHDGWIPMTESPFYRPKEAEKGHDHGGQGGMQHDSMNGEDHSARDAGADTTPAADGETLWTCGMHPEVIEDEPGICPICQMDLTPLKQGTAAGGGTSVAIDPVTLQNIGVVTVPVQRRDLSRTIRSNGVVQVAEENEVTVNARTSGWVEELRVSRTGEQVRKGQVLLELYSPELVAAQEDYLLALANSERFRGSSIEHVSRGGEELLASAKRRLQLWNVADSEIERLERTREASRTVPLTAPASGIVLERNVIEGAAVKAGQDLFTIADLDKIWVIAQIYEYELPWVSAGDSVTVTSPYDPALELAGVVDYIYPTVDAQTRTAELRIVLDNPDLRLKPQMYVDAHVFADKLHDVVSVPKPAVIRSGERDIVFVKKDEGLFEPREVILGMETDDYYAIARNLHAGEEVVTSAQFLLDSEAKLQEAIQRRIQKRKEMGKTTDTADAGAMTGHQH